MILLVALAAHNNSSSNNNNTSLALKKKKQSVCRIGKRQVVTDQEQPHDSHFKIHNHAED